MTRHPDLIAPTRHALRKLGVLYVIENVVGAPLLSPILLCGSMFGSTRLRRHRLFECNFQVPQMPCQHNIQYNCISVAGNPGGSSTRDGAQRFGSTKVWRELMQMYWTNSKELAEAIPPFYTAYIGRYLKDALCQI